MLVGMRRMSLAVLCFGCSAGHAVAPELTLYPSTYSTDVAPINQPLIPFTQTDSSQCLGLEDARLSFLNSQEIDEIRRYLMPVIHVPSGLPGTQAIAVETSHLSYTYDAGSGVLKLRRGAVSDTGRIRTVSGVTTLELQEHFQSLSYCRQATPLLAVYTRG